MWIAYSDAAYQSLAGYLGAFDVVSMTPYEKEDPTVGWHSYGTAQFVDGWICPGVYGADALNYSWTVNVDQKDEDPNIIRLNNPYMADGCPLLQADPTCVKEGGYIVIDISDPTFVRVSPNVFSGFLNGTTKIYNTNAEGYFMAQGYSKEETMAGLQEIVSEYSTYADGVIKIPNAYIQTSMNGMLTYWQDAYGNDLTEYMVATITLNQTGIDEISSTDENAPIEYYNLQGVRVSNPEKGDVVITRQGSKVSKIVVR